MVGFTEPNLVCDNHSYDTIHPFDTFFLMDMPVANTTNDDFLNIDITEIVLMYQRGEITGLLFKEKVEDPSVVDAELILFGDLSPNGPVLTLEYSTSIINIIIL